MSSDSKEYKVVLVEADSDHELAKYVDDEQELFCIGPDGRFCEASEFFHMKGVMKFIITEEKQ